MIDWNHFAEIGEFCIGVGRVEWMAQKRGGYCYARIWRKSDPQMVVGCNHRHRTPGGALKCGRSYVRGGQVRRDFDMDEGGSK